MLSATIDRLRTGFTVFWQSVKSFDANGNSSVAASLAYYSLFAMVPILLLLFYSLSFFITSSRAVMTRITLLLSQVIPYYSETILREVYTLVRYKGIWGLFSLCALLWAAMPLMGTLRGAFFDIFKVEARPSFWKTKLFDMGVIVLTLFLLIAITFSNVTFKKFLIMEGDTSLYNAASYFLTVIVMSIFYLVFVPMKVPFCYIFTGALVTTFLWGIIRPVFSLFLSYNPQYGITFGSLKALFIIIIWIYYSFVVLLFGIEIIANLRRTDVLLLKKLFREEYNEKTLLKLKNGFMKKYNSGEAIFNEDEKGSEMFYVLSGSVLLEKNEQTLKVIRKGEYFGEMALLIGTPRTTAAVAGEEGTVLAVIISDNFESLLREDSKLSLSFLKELARRIKKTDESLN